MGDLAILDSTMLLPLPLPFLLDASGSVRLRLSPRPTPPTSPPVTDLATPPSVLAMLALATLVSAMPVSAMPVLAPPTLAMLPLPTGTTCGNFGKSKVQSFSLRRHQQQRCKNMHVIPSDLE